MTQALQDQIGAMALIDNLRRQEMQVNEHLDLPNRRVAIEAKIRAYYQANGIEVDDNTIAQGVKDYFKSRLAFEKKTFSPIVAMITKLYIRRDRWLKGVLLFIAAVACIFVTVFYIDKINENRNIESANQVIQSNNTSVHDLKQRIADFSKQVKTLESTLQEIKIPIAEKVLAQAQLNVNQASTQLLSFNTVVLADRTNFESISLLENKKREGLIAITEQFANIDVLLATVKDIIDAKSRMDATASNQTYSKTLRLDIVKSRFDETNELFNDTVLLNPSDLPPKVNTFIEFLNSAMSIPALVVKLDDITKKFVALDMPKEDMSIVNAMVSNAKLMADKVSAKNLADIVNELSTLYVFATTPLTVNIVDRKGVKSGVERQFSPSKGKSWFLIAESLNDAGDAVPIRVNNFETGEVVSTLKFGVRVTEEQYQAAKKEKLSTGHISERKIGSKSGNAILLTFDAPFNKRPDMITEW